MTLILNNGITICGIDLSLRATGVAIIRRERDDEGVSINLLKAYQITNPSRKRGTSGIKVYEFEKKCFQHLYKSLLDISYVTDRIIIEVPTFTQDAVAAYAMGMCHAAAAMIPDMNVKIVSPKMLKEWSGSKRGDKKGKVKEKVQSQINLPEIRNNNIIDAIGICLAECDKISLQEHYDQAAEK